MAKSKKKADDFKKVKLKVGKKLKKPTETNTSFKAGKVILLEQLKRDAAGNEVVPVTKRKLAFTDLLHHLRHYNANMRKDGVIGLKELLTENPHLVRSNLCTLIEYLGPLFTDSESEILKTSIAVWGIILANVDSANLSPYFALLTAHLNCAMTHLNADVKRFSLKMLNLLLTSHSDLLRRSTSFDFIRCFLNSLPHAQSLTSSGNTAARSLMTRSSKHELLKVVKNILSIFNIDAATTYRNSDFGPTSTGPVIDCGSSSSAIISVSLSAAEWPQNSAFDFDDYVRPLGSTSSEIERYSNLINSVVPFCHALWIEVTSADDQESVDCFTFDLASLVIMNDILLVYNSLLRRPVDLLLAAKNENLDSDFDVFKTSLRKLMAKSFLDRYHNLLPCRRAARKSGEEARISDYNLNIDACSSVNFGLCRFLAYVSVIMEKHFAYPVEKISDFLLFTLSGEKKRIDSQTLRCGVELARDLRVLTEATGKPGLRQHYAYLGRLIMDCLLTQSGKWKIKADIISWICQDLEDLVDIQEWPKFNEFVERLPSIMSFLLEEATKTTSNDSTSSSVFGLLYRLTRILLLRISNLPVERSISERVIESDLLHLLLSNIDQFSPAAKKEALNLLYYAVPLKEKVVSAIVALTQNREGNELELLKKLLT